MCNCLKFFYLCERYKLPNMQFAIREREKEREVFHI